MKLSTTSRCPVCDGRKKNTATVCPTCRRELSAEQQKVVIDLEAYWRDVAA